MANRTYAPDMAARLAMADSEARAAVRAAVDAQPDADAAAGETPESDDESLQSPGRASSHFIVHDQYGYRPSHPVSVRSEDAPRRGYGSGVTDADLMDVDDDDMSLYSDSDASEATTEYNPRPHPGRPGLPRSTFYPDLPAEIARAQAEAAARQSVPPRLNPGSDRENITPEPVVVGRNSLDFVYTASYQSDMYMPDPNKPVKPYLPFPDAANDPTLSHLREISGLASWTVSSYKPSCGVAALLNPSTATFWQSDGPQPHLLNIHFFKLVRIVKLRIYLDFELDESYTPTRLSFAAGTHEYDAVEFAEWKWDGVGPKGWVDVDLSQCGSDEERERELVDDYDSDDAAIAGVLRCFFVQVRVLENHQNGKDTHIRGVQIFARDERVKRILRRARDTEGDDRVEEIRQGIEEADWMGEPEIR